MEFNTHFFENYLKEAPLPLALERTLECHLLSKQTFQRPILDIGCGEGLFAKQLFKEKIDVGIDPNPKELQRASLYNAYHELYCCKGDKIPKENGSFNTILSNSVIEHIIDIDSVLKESHRLLSNTGYLYITVPTARFDEYTCMHQLFLALKLKTLSSKYRHHFNKFWAHHHYYTPQAWIEKFEKLGFHVEKYEEYGSKSTCMFNAFATPFSLIPFITKKFTNQWFINKKIRYFTAKVLSRIFKPLSTNPSTKKGTGGLILFCLKKQA
jgi:2-polyprenyl-3-methyl-5-hydroxy-6-metoxy-1,4-benzoquinol methylase